MDGISWGGGSSAAEDEDSVSPYAAPARVDSVHGLPSLYLDCVQIDMFALEDVKYAKRFMETNIPTELETAKTGRSHQINEFHTPGHRIQSIIWDMIPIDLPGNQVDLRSS